MDPRILSHLGIDVFHQRQRRDTAALGHDEAWAGFGVRRDNWHLVLVSVSLGQEEIDLLLKIGKAIGEVQGQVGADQFSESDGFILFASENREALKSQFFQTFTSKKQRQLLVAPHPAMLLSEPNLKAPLWHEIKQWLSAHFS